MDDLHSAARWSDVTAVRQLLRQGAEVEALIDGRTALWDAVMGRRPEIAAVLVEAGADPWRPMMAGWSPGRLNLAGPAPESFGPPPAGVQLTAAEQEAVADSRRLVAALGDHDGYGFSVACVSGIDVAEAIRRLGGEVVPDPDEEDEDDYLLAVTDVPGGCVVYQPWTYTASTPVVLARLTPGTWGYAMYDNPKSGRQGRFARDGVQLDHDLHPGGGDVAETAPADEILRAYLYTHQAVAYCCAWAGLHPADDRAFIPEPDRWLRLPDGNLWG